MEENKTQDQTAKSEEEKVQVEAGEITEEAGTATVKDDGLLDDGKKEVSVESIMDEEVRVEEPEKVPGTPYGVQKRIDKEVARRKQAESERQVALQKLRDIEAANSAPKDKPLVPVLDDFDTREDYQDAMDKYQTDIYAYKRTIETRESQERTSAERLQKNVDKFQENAERMRSKYNDFDALVLTGENAFGHLNKIILDVDYGPEIAYFLRKNPEKLESLKSLDQVSAGIAIGELSGQFKTVQKKTTNAPKPLSTVSADTETVVNDIYKIKDNSEFLRRRNEQILAGRNKR